MGSEPVITITGRDSPCSDYTLGEGHDLTDGPRELAVPLSLSKQVINVVVSGRLFNRR
jgi:hypothetical protein